MKTLIAALLLIATTVNANSFKSDYFQFAGPGNYHIYDGALFSGKGLSKTQNGTVIAVVTHSPANGSLLPDSWVNAGYAETWAPLVIGGGFGNGTGNVTFGPLVNIGPQVQALVLNALNYFAPASLPNAKTFLTNQAKPGAVDLTFAFGILPNLVPIQDGHFVNLKTALIDPARYYAGPALHF